MFPLLSGARVFVSRVALRHARLLTTSRLVHRLHNLLRKYTKSQEEKPLGIAVFGSPGAGKNYGITQLAESIFKETRKSLQKVECNLAQFGKPEELYQKLLEARSIAQGGNIPMVVLDEFDVKIEQEEFGWCKYLLSVLQDGKFQVNNIVYDIGKAFIVCAGGLNESFKEFELKSQHNEAVKAKIPDFIGRLRGHVNIKGPNPYFPHPSDDPKTQTMIEGLNKAIGGITLSDIEITTKTEKTTRTEKKLSHSDRKRLDPLYKVRRAVLLRDIIRQRMPSIYHEKETCNCPSFSCMEISGRA